MKQNWYSNRFAHHIIKHTILFCWVGLLDWAGSKSKFFDIFLYNVFFYSRDRVLCSNRWIDFRNCCTQSLIDEFNLNKIGFHVFSLSLSVINCNNFWNQVHKFILINDRICHFSHYSERSIGDLFAVGSFAKDRRRLDGMRYCEKRVNFSDVNFVPKFGRP